MMDENYVEIEFMCVLFIDFGLSLFKFEFRFCNSAYRKCAFYGSLVSEFCQ
jgi:hypothetical protein